MNIPKYIQSKINDFTPKFKDVKFDNETEFLKWLVETTKVAIVLEDAGQDLIKFWIAESGEILHTELPNLASIYNGSLLLDNPELILKGDQISIWNINFKELMTIKYKVKKVLRKGL